MSNYRRVFVPGGTVFLTIVTHHRAPIFGEAANVDLLRQAIREVMAEEPFRILAAVVLPDHVHFLWSLPPGDSAYPRRVGKMKVSFTRSLRATGSPFGSSGVVDASRLRRREASVWHRRFWEHTIVDEDDLERHLDYIHHNSVKHECTSCPHAWPYSSFGRWVEAGLYDARWGCRCEGRVPIVPLMAKLDDATGEWE